MDDALTHVQGLEFHTLLVILWNFFLYYFPNELCTNVK